MGFFDFFRKRSKPIEPPSPPLDVEQFVRNCYGGTLYTEYRKQTDPSVRAALGAKVAEQARETPNWRCEGAWLALNEVDQDALCEVVRSLLDSPDEPIRRRAKDALHKLTCVDTRSPLTAEICDVLQARIAPETDSLLRHWMVAFLRDTPDRLVALLRDPTYPADAKRFILAEGCIPGRLLLPLVDDEYVGPDVTAHILLPQNPQNDRYTELRPELLKRVLASPRLLPAALGAACERLRSDGRNYLGRDEVHAALMLAGLRHTDPEIRARTLAAFPDEELSDYAPDLYAVVAQALSDPDESVRAAAAAVLDRNMAAVERELATKHYRRAVDHLGRMNSPRAEALLGAHEKLRQRVADEVCVKGSPDDREIARRLSSLSSPVECGIVGEWLWKNGGHERMVRVCNSYGGNVRILEEYWDGIGTFQG
ncbi:HEAT repeat domain-containing protein [Urbifossiella limnaea]|uniref:HEAT repeat domain-containing protein n=1 Tax=Urbifossiella limnaea TaxID=2528023 RepID=A0A517Y211_9BACT|nr:hypothetical protein [Urbifossiella limnaea]QDU23774.1 hypothetical protein ETAA1_57810 [Urbifossiella limnaea]